MSHKFMSHKFCSFPSVLILASVSLVNILITPKSGLAQYYSGGFPASQMVQVRWTSTNLSADYLTKYVRPAVNGWNGVSSKVSLSQVVESLPYDVNVIFGNSPRYGQVGVMNPSCPPTTGICPSTGTWKKAEVVGFINQIVNLNLSDTEIVGSVYAHEFGHALAMDHSSPPTGTISVMPAGIRTTYSAQAFDKANLRKKWGN
jgi:hypothetical protein